MNERTISNNQLTAYRNHLLQEEHAAATVEKYLRDTGSFAAWLAGRPVTKELVTAWKANLLAEGRAPVTVNAKLSALDGLFRFLGWLECQVRFLKIQRRVFRDAARELRLCGPRRGGPDLHRRHLRGDAGGQNCAEKQHQRRARSGLVGVQGTLAGHDLLQGQAALPGQLQPI